MTDRLSSLFLTRTSMSAASLGEVLFRDEHPSPVHRLCDRAGVEADDRDPLVEGLEERNAEPLVLAQAEVDVGQLEEGQELGEIDVTRRNGHPGGRAGR